MIHDFVDGVGDGMIGRGLCEPSTPNTSETTMSESLPDRIRSHLIATRAELHFPACNGVQVDEEEKILGFQIHPLLKSLYFTIANGGFGPGYGIVGVSGGHGQGLGTLAQAYRQHQEGSAYNGDEWPDGLLPFCDWGCNIVSCVDCLGDSATVYQSESCNTFRMNYSLEDFMEMWLAGVSILDQLGKTRGRIMAIDRVTGQKFALFGKRRA
jgi:hypothetical protein